MVILKTCACRTYVINKFSECLKAIGQDAGEKGSSENNHYKQILGQKVLHLLAFFSLVYVGVEFAVGGIFNEWFK